MKRGDLQYFVQPHGNWLQLLRPVAPGPARPALFLDRDGVLVDEVGYLHRVEDLRVVPGAAEAIRRVRKAGWYVVVVTNQAGIAKGMYGWSEFAAVQAALLAHLHALGAEPDMVAACPFHADGLPEFRHDASSWRKPEAGMLLEAARQLPIDLGRSWIVGDKASDIEAGQRAELAGGVHVLTGHGATERASALRLRSEAYAVAVADGIADVPSVLRRHAGAGAPCRQSAAFGPG